MRAERPDVVEAHSPYLGAVGAFLAGRSTARALTAFWHSDHLGTYVQPALERALGRRAAQRGTDVLRRGLRWLLAPFDATFVAGRAQAHMLRAAGVSPVFHVPFGADVTTFHPGAGNPGVRRRLLDLAPGGGSPALLVGVGRLSFEKRWDVVLEAFGRLRARRDAVLVLFGDGPERARLQARAPTGVHFAGFEPDRDRLAAALAQADALVHGCACETSGLGIVEAVASGLPVVVPDGGGAAENADPCCRAIYRSHDADACAEAIDRLLACDRDSLRARARAAADRAPSAEQHVRDVTAVYRDLLGG